MDSDRRRRRHSRRVEIHVEGLKDLGRIKEAGIEGLRGLGDVGASIEAGLGRLADLQIFGWQPFRKKEPAPASQRLARLILLETKQRNDFFGHLAAYGAGALFLVATNLVTTFFVPTEELPARVWSVMAVSGWGIGVLAHAFDVFLTKPQRHADTRRALEAELASAPPAPLADEDDLDQLRDRLIQKAEDARATLRTHADAAATVSQGEVQALAVVAWLDAARRQLDGANPTQRERREIALKLSSPDYHDRHAELRELLARLDRRDQLLGHLELLTRDRRARLESFLLALESARIARPESIRAVAAPLSERVALLEEVAALPPGSARDGNGGGPASTQEVADARTRRIQEEVRLAQELQRSILPTKAPPTDLLEVAQVYRPCNEVGGDFYDFHIAGPGRLLVAIGDASGHGIDSSMVSSMAKSGLYLQASAGRSLDEAMAELNRMMCDTLGRRRLMTLALIEIDTAAGRIRHASAGQVYPLLVRRGEIRELELPGYPLGIRRDTVYHVAEHDFEPGDSLLLFTDGVVEALDAGGRPFGWDGLYETIRRVPGVGAEALIDTIAADLSRHLGSVAPQDDVTLLAARYQP